MISKMMNEHLWFVKLKYIVCVVCFFCFSNFVNAQSNPNKVLKEDTTIVLKNGIKEITIKYTNGTVKEIHHYKDTLKHGIQETYFQNGILSTKSEYKNGFQDGLTLIYNYQGLLIEKKNYKYNPTVKKSELNGDYIIYLDNRVQIKSSYKNNLKEGKYFEYYPAGNLKLRANFIEGKFTGLKEEYLINGQLLSKANFLITGDADHRVSLLNGRSLSYSPGKILLADINFKLGNKDGVCKEFYSSGILKQEVIYKEGKRNGLGLYYYENGTLKSKNSFFEVILINDSLYKNIFDGPKLEFYASGKLQSAEYYKMGKKNGRWERYSESGKLTMVGEYSNDLKIGEQSSWDPFGNMTTQCFYNLVKTDSGFITLKSGPEKNWMDGVLTSETFFVNGKEEGVRKNYYKSGQISSQSKMVNDFMAGEYKEYYEDGSLKSTRNYYGIYDATKSKKYYSVGWRKEFEKDGKPKIKVFTDSLDNIIFIRRYYNGNRTSIDVNKAFLINYFPDGKVMSMIIKDEYDREVFGQYYYRNGRIRKVAFQNIEKKNIATVDFTDNGEILNRSTQSYLNPDSLLPSLQVTEEVRKSLGSKLLPSVLFTDSVLDGTYEIFYSNNRPMARLNFKKDLPHGDFVFFFPLNGDTLCFKHFELGIPSDYYVNNFAGVFPLLRGSKVSNVRDGYEERFRQNGVIESKRIYSRLNKQVSENTEYFENGKIKSYQNYIYGEYTNFSTNGYLVSQNKIVDSVNMVKEIAEYYLDQDAIKSRNYLKANKYDGEALMYFSNGRIETRTIYVDGLRQGLFEKFDLNGNKIYYGEYRDDKQEGVWISIKDGSREELVYKNNKLQVKTSAVVCSCVDTTYSANKLGFAPSISSLVEYPKLKNNFSGFFNAIDSLNYRSLFFTGLQTSNSSSNGFASLNLLMFKEFAVSIPADNQLKLVFNPCITKGYISRMDAYVNYGKNPEDTRLTFYPKRISIALQKGPLKSNSKDYNFPTAFFDVKDVEYDYTDGFELNIADTSNSCFTPIIINEFLKVAVNRGGPLDFDLEKLSYDYVFINAGLLKQEEAKAFFGFSYSDASVSFPLKTTQGIFEFNATTNTMLAGGKFTCGIINIPCAKVGQDSYRIKIYDKEYEINSQDVKIHWIQNGFTRVKLVYDEIQKMLNLNFFAE
jgi:antitoxin component YwqK of YwqJK toxin-antitoxin module